MELFERIRRDHREEGLSVRALARRHHVHRRTVRQALVSAWPPSRAVPHRAAPVMGPWIPLIREWLVADQQAPRKQRHTARRVWQRLVEEHDADVAEPSVRRVVRRIRAELTDHGGEVTIVARHEPGKEAEADFGQATFIVGGEPMTVHLFHLHLSASAKGVTLGFLGEDQTALLEGHAVAFARLGRVPARIRYDNLTAAVARVLAGRDRVETDRFIALHSHYGFESIFCEPGQRGPTRRAASRARWGDSAAATWSRCRRWPAWPSSTCCSSKRMPLTIAATWPGDARPWPGPTSWSDPTCARCPMSRSMRPCRSAPGSIARPASACGSAGTRCRPIWPAAASTCGSGPAVSRCSTPARSWHVTSAARRRAARRSSSTTTSRSSDASPARGSGAFTSAHERFWKRARRKLGDAAGTRALIEVLLLHRSLPFVAVHAALDAVEGVGSADPALVAIEARRIADGRGQTTVTIDPGERRGWSRPVPALAGYDGLLDAGAAR